jgi:hypothetical protein
VGDEDNSFARLRCRHSLAGMLRRPGHVWSWLSRICRPGSPQTPPSRSVPAPGPDYPPPAQKWPSYWMKPLRWPEQGVRAGVPYC